jgi:hypothetical protein
MKRHPSLISLTVSLTASLLLASCGGTYLKSRSVPDLSSVTGKYRVLLVGRQHAKDYRTMAILDLEGDAYEIVPRLPEFSYEVVEGLDAAEAVASARWFLRRQVMYRHKRTEARRIFTEEGVTVGYELRLHYKPFVLGNVDMTDVRYVLVDGNTVRMLIDVRQVEVQ